MAGPTQTSSWHRSRWHKSHPEASLPAANVKRDAGTSFATKVSFGVGRAIALSAGLILVSAASQIALAKGWADWIPDWVVIALYLIAVIPIAYWAVSHNKLRQIGRAHV